MKKSTGRNSARTKKNTQKSEKDNSKNKVLFVLGSFDNDGRDGSKDSDEKDNSQSKRPKSRDNSGTTGNNNSRRTRRKGKTSEQNLAITNNQSEFRDPDMSQFKGQGSQEITEAQNLGTVLEEIKKNQLSKICFLLEQQILKKLVIKKRSKNY